jgi:hypothetical protein
MVLWPFKKKAVTEKTGYINRVLKNSFWLSVITNKVRFCERSEPKSEPFVA